MTQTIFAGVLTLEHHADVCGNANGPTVSGQDQADQPLQRQRLPCVIDNPPRGFRCETFAPALLVDEKCELHFVPAVDVPWQQAAAAEKCAGFPFDGSPQAKLRMPWMTVKEPFELLLRLLVRLRSIREVLPGLGILVQ